jgi:two-component system, NarL family, response regulator YdfI
VIRVFIVAASPLARSGLQSLLADGSVEVVGSAPDIDSLVALLADAEADAVLIDASGGNAESSLESLAHFDLAAEVPVIVLAASSRPQWSAEALRAGVRALLPSDVSTDQLSTALQAVTAGLLVLHPSDVDVLLPAATPASEPLTELAEPLTRREREVLQMLASGLSNKEIAARLNISDHTAKFHVASIFGKLGATTRTEAVTAGIRRGLVLL